MSVDWKEYRLGDITEWSSGGTPSKKNANFWNGTIPWISASSMRGNRYNESNLKITQEGLKAGSRIAKKNSILLLVRGSTLHQRIPVGIATSDVSFNQDVKAIIAKEDFIEPWYLLFWFMAKEKDLLNMVENTGIGAGKLDTKRLQDMLIKIPSDVERNRICRFAKALDDKLLLNRQINQTLESISQAIFKSWFVDFEPVKAKIAALESGEDAEGVTCAAMRAISGKTNDELDKMEGGRPEDYAQLKTTAGLFPSAMQDSELGEVPKGWALKPLYETAEYVNGAAFKAKYFSDNRSGLPIIKIAELKQGISSGTKYTNEDVKEKYFIDNDDVLYSWSGSPETSLEVFKWFGGKGYLNQHIFKLNFENSQQKYFTYFLLQHMKPLLIRTAQQKQTTGLGHITVADMKRMLVVYPDNQTLTRFSEVVGSIYEQNSILQRENSKLVALRDTLLPKLLSGELSVDAIEMAREV